MDELIKYMISKIGYTLTAIIGGALPGSLLIFVWNRKLYMELDLLKLIILSFAITLIILKFLKKGFDTYILWVEGDIDTPSLTFVTYFARALILAISFPKAFPLTVKADTNALNINCILKGKFNQGVHALPGQATL